MNLALFDLDNTLLSGDSDFEWAQFLISKGVVDAELQAAKTRFFTTSTRPARSTSTNSSPFNWHRSPATPAPNSTPGTRNT